MLTDTVIEDHRWHALDLETLAETAARAALAHLDLAPERFEIAVLGCDDARIAALNADFRGKAQPTNVLSWPALDHPIPAPGLAPDLSALRHGAAGAPFATALGDIAIAFDTCQAEAAAAALAMPAHVTHLLVHATLHLLGYDHIRDLDATLMEATETEILGKLGINSPYCTAGPEGP